MEVPGGKFLYLPETKSLLEFSRSAEGGRKVHDPLRTRPETQIKALFTTHDLSRPIAFLEILQSLAGSKDLSYLVSSGFNNKFNDLDGKD